MDDWYNPKWWVYQGLGCFENHFSTSGSHRVVLVPKKIKAASEIPNPFRKNVVILGNQLKHSEFTTRGK